MAATRPLLLLLAVTGVSSFAPLPSALPRAGAAAPIVGGRHARALSPISSNTPWGAGMGFLSAPGPRVAARRCSAAAVSMAAGQSKLAKTLNKMAVTVSVDVPAGEERLSKKLRKTGIATIFATSALLPTYAAEQNTKGKGDFPGPAPVILRDAELTEDGLRAARAAGATGVVLPSALGVDGAKALAAVAEEVGLEALWEVCTQEEYAAAEGAGAEAFLVSSVEESFGVAPAFWEGLPKGKEAKVVIAEIKALQEGNSEIELGRTLAGVGCKALLLSGALEAAAMGYEGEEQAMWYVEQAYKALRSKQSSKIQAPPLMGQANMVGYVGRHEDYDVSTPPPTIQKKQIRGYS
mmetsp:Transcript_14692/g.35971  ORF Transcript_14692/g.35971 Transcript_14692/m.35971 type:complete len:351 (-) Transcript_14692:225-1277(-)